MSKEPNLKPCPFCGAEARYDNRFGIHSIECDTRGCILNLASLNPRKKNECVEAWNRRAEHPDIARIRAILGLPADADVVDRAEKLRDELEYVRDARISLFACAAANELIEFFGPSATGTGKRVIDYAKTQIAMVRKNWKKQVRELNALIIPATEAGEKGQP